MFISQIPAISVINLDRVLSTKLTNTDVSSLVLFVSSTSVLSSGEQLNAGTLFR